VASVPLECFPRVFPFFFHFFPLLSPPSSGSFLYPPHPGLVLERSPVWTSPPGLFNVPPNIVAGSMRSSAQTFGVALPRPSQLFLSDPAMYLYFPSRPPQVRGPPPPRPPHCHPPPPPPLATLRSPAAALLPPFFFSARPSASPRPHGEFFYTILPPEHQAGSWRDFYCPWYIIVTSASKPPPTLLMNDDLDSPCPLPVEPPHPFFFPPLIHAACHPAA